MRILCVAGWASALALVFSGCQSSRNAVSSVVEDPVGSGMMTLSAASLAPVAACYLSLEGSNRGYRFSAISVGAPEDVFSRRITREEMRSIASTAAACCSGFHPLYYIGSREDIHFLVRDPVLGFRTIYSIAEDEWSVNEPFPLTADSSKWRSIFIPFGPVTIPVDLGEQGFVIRPDESDPDRFWLIPPEEDDAGRFFEQDEPLMLFGEPESPATLIP